VSEQEVRRLGAEELETRGGDAAGGSPDYEDEEWLLGFAQDENGVNIERCPGCQASPGRRHKKGCTWLASVRALRKREEAPVWGGLGEPGDEPLPWLVEGILRQGNLAMLYGREGSFKSFIALDLANRVSTGQPFDGHEIGEPVASMVGGPGRVVYVAAEAHRQFPPRQEAWERAYLGGERNGRILWVKEPVDLLESSERELWERGARRRSGLLPAGELARRVGAEMEDPVALVVIDSLHASMPDASDVSDRDLGLVIAGARRFIETADCAVLLVHHSNVSDTRERGHGSLGAALDLRLHVRKTKAGPVVTCTKNRHGAEGWEIRLRPKPVQLAAGEQSAVLGPPREDEALDDKDVAVLEAVEGGATTQAEVVGVTGLPQPTVSRRLRKLVESGHLVRGGEGKGTTFSPPTDDMMDA
jgi:hypothetical protein